MALVLWELNFEFGLLYNLGTAWKMNTVNWLMTDHR